MRLTTIEKKNMALFAMSLDLPWPRESYLIPGSIWTTHAVDEYWVEHLTVVILSKEERMEGKTLFGDDPEVFRVAPLLAGAKWAGPEDIVLMYGGGVYGEIGPCTVAVGTAIGCLRLSLDYPIGIFPPEMTEHLRFFDRSVRLNRIGRNTPPPDGTISGTPFGAPEQDSRVAFHERLVEMVSYLQGPYYRALLESCGE